MLWSYSCELTVRKSPFVPTRGGSGQNWLSGWVEMQDQAQELLPFFHITGTTHRELGLQYGSLLAERIKRTIAVYRERWKNNFNEFKSFHSLIWPELSSLLSFKPSVWWAKRRDYFGEGSSLQAADQGLWCRLLWRDRGHRRGGLCAPPLDLCAQRKDRNHPSCNWQVPPLTTSLSLSLSLSHCSHHTHTHTHTERERERENEERWRCFG